MENVIGKVNSLESFGSTDGPGIRYVIFLQGCRMRCKYCHNPETWALEGGDEYTAADLLNKAMRYKNYWGKEGGITVSGGEALLQIDFVTELFKLAKEKGVNTALDTSGNPFSMDPEYLEKFNELMEYTDLFILDIKEMDEDKHVSLTGHTNANILQLAKYLSDHNKHMWIRHVLVPDLTDDETGLQELRTFLDGLNPEMIDRVQVLPYHTLGMIKWENMGIPYALEGVHVPSEEQINKAREILKAI